MPRALGSTSSAELYFHDGQGPRHMLYQLCGGFEEYGLRRWDSKERGSLPIYGSQYMPMYDQKDLLTVSAVLGELSIC